MVKNLETKSTFITTEIFQKISDICSTVNSTRTPQELLETSLIKTMKLFGARRGSIFMVDKNGQELTLKIARGIPINEQVKIIKKLGEGVVGKVAEIKKPIFVEDITADGRFTNHKTPGAYRTPSFLCAPLLFKDALLGVINIADKESETRFTSDELQVLDFISSQIALNYRRAQLYQKFKNVLKERQSLKDELGKTSEEKTQLKERVITQERLASLGKLAGGIAHELNNPLDGSLRYINLALAKLDEEDPVREYLLEAKHGLDRMVNIVRNLLACSRNALPKMKKIDVHEAIRDAIGSVRTALFQKNITIVEEFGKEIPPVIDYGIERIVENLLRNAIDATPEKSAIIVSTSFVSPYIVFQVKDKGCGIPQEDLDKIFEPFYTTKEMEKGCGLGLTIVYEIIKTYNGEIHVESLPGKGSIFTVKIPVDK